MKTAIGLLLATLSASASAQTAQDQAFQAVISKLKTCVQTNASSVQTAGVKDAEDIDAFFFKTCGPLPSDLDPARVGAIPPGILRRSVSDAWHAFVCENGCKKICGSLNTLFAHVCIDSTKRIALERLSTPECVDVCVSNRVAP